jgi:hypothetical protein
MEAMQEEEALEDAELKKKMLYRAQLMQYEDDFDDQDFYVNKNRKKRANSKAESESSDDEDDNEEQKDNSAQKSKQAEKKVILQKGS